MKGFCPLASGSKGNSLYLGTAQTKILIDAGLSGRATKKRLEEIDVDIADIDAILITHEHTDHIQGLKILALQHNIPVLANTETAKGIANAFKDCPKFKIFSTGETFEFGDLEIHPFTVQHDTLDPVAFTIKTGSLKFGLCADLGFVTSLVRYQLQKCDYLYLEANHEPSMVHACPRPLLYKQRVLSRHGHLSNIECAQLLSEVWHEDLKQIWLAHLSGECNSPETALKIVSEHLKKKHIDAQLCIAPQKEIAPAISF